MRRNPITVLTCSTVAVGLLLSGCADDTTPGADITTTTPPPTATASSPPSSAANTVASCVVGRWRTTALSAEGGNEAASADVAGGAGITITIEPTGATVVDFSDMQPFTFTANVGNAEIGGRFTYAGRATGTMTTGSAASAGSSPATSGTWQPAGDLNWNDTRLTVDLTDPVQARPLDDVPIGQYTGDAAERTGNVVDVDPFFDAGRYTCAGDTLTVTPDEGGNLPLTLQRA